MLQTSTRDNRVRSKLFVACQRWWFQWRFWFVPSDPGYLREEEEHKPDLVRNCHWTVVADRHSWNVSTQNAFSLPFAAILVNCAPSGEMHNYCTPHIIKENWEFFYPSMQLYTAIWSVLCMTSCYNPWQSFLINLYSHASLNDGDAFWEMRR